MSAPERKSVLREECARTASGTGAVARDTSTAVVTLGNVSALRTKGVTVNCASVSRVEVDEEKRTRVFVEREELCQ